MNMQDALKKIDKKLDSLADIMTEGFDRIYDKIDGLEARADKSDSKIGKIENELREVRVVQDQHTQTLKQHTGTLAEHTVILKRLDGDTEMLIEDDLRYAKRIKKIEKLAKLRR